ncbi:MAG TPA: arginine--tRNA ligase [Bacillota bacterium]
MTTGAARPYATQRIQDDIRRRLADALKRCVQDDGLPAEVLDADITLEIPRDKGHGDYATNLALTLARVARQRPRQLAERIAARLDLAGSKVARAEVAGPGFINFYLEPTWLYEVLRDVHERGPAYGDVDIGRGARVLIEFVSANPTGPLNVVNARHAALGDALANLLEAAGYRPEREFYVNDAGNQVRMLGLAMETRYRQLLGEPAELPEGAYPGAYIIDLARELLALEGPALLERPAEERRERMARFAVERIVAQQRQVLERYGVRYDRWFHESEVRAAGGPEAVVRRLSERGYTYERDGAVWLRSTAFGDDKDRVLVKSDGEFTYIVPDIAYHLNKLERGYDTLIDLLGQDHHGYHVRMGAALAALGYDPKALEVIYLQMVHLVRGGQAARMSKRQGEYVTLEDFLNEVSTDAARYFFLMRSPDTTMEFDLDLANLQTQDNPVYYVQYAHARIAGILRQAAEAGIELGAGDGEAGPTDAVLVPIADESEFELLRKIGALPDEIAGAALAREPHRLTRYAHELAATFHQFYTRCRVLGEEPAVTRARLLLVRATQLALQRVLRILGVTAPERM